MKQILSLPAHYELESIFRLLWNIVLWLFSSGLIEVVTHKKNIEINTIKKRKKRISWAKWHFEKKSAVLISVSCLKIEERATLPFRVFFHLTVFKANWRFLMRIWVENTKFVSRSMRHTSRTMGDQRDRTRHWSYTDLWLTMDCFLVNLLIGFPAANIEGGKIVLESIYVRLLTVHFYRENPLAWIDFVDFLSKLLQRILEVVCDHFCNCFFETRSFECFTQTQYLLVHTLNFHKNLLWFVHMQLLTQHLFKLHLTAGIKFIQHCQQFFL